MAVKYQWNQYSVVKTSGYVESVSSTLSSFNYGFREKITCGKSYTFNTQSGSFTLNGVSNPYAENYSKTTYPYFERDGVIYLCESVSVMIMSTVKGYPLVATLGETYTKGDLIGVVTSDLQSDYPTAGLHSDGYWYEYIGEVRGIGNIGGIKFGGITYGLSGSGLVKLPGVLCPLTSSLMKHGGVLKSLFVGVPVSRLPNGYTEVEYIQSTGTQYIDTGFCPDQDTRAVVDMEIPAKSKDQALFGTRKAISTNAFYVLAWANNDGYQTAYSNNEYALINGINSVGRHVFDRNKESLYVDGVAISTQTYMNFTTTYSFYLFTINNAGSTFISSYPAACKLYSCKIYDNGTLARDFIPCTNSSGVTGLYDLVNGAFYSNAGTGVFTAGPAV